ncbi:MAG: helix-turn-helix domain-containing protein [Clostridiales bacterium]|nr:helix-turn-helix domain-containing protein [Clostridiales bacterium]
MKLSSVWLYEQLKKEFEITGAAGLSGRDGYLRPLFGSELRSGEHAAHTQAAHMQALYTQTVHAQAVHAQTARASAGTAGPGGKEARSGHVRVIPAESKQEVREWTDAGLPEKTFCVFCLSGTAGREPFDEKTENGNAGRNSDGKAEGMSAGGYSVEKAEELIADGAPDGKTEGRNARGTLDEKTEDNNTGGVWVCVATGEMDECSGAAAVLNYLQMAFDSCDEWEDEVIRLLTGNAGIVKVLELSAGFLGNPLMVMGADFSLTAAAGMEKLPERARLFTEDGVNVDYMNALLQDEEYQKITQAKQAMLYPGYISGYRSVNRNLFINGQPAYRLVLTECDNPVTQGCICILENLSRHLEYQLSREMPASMKGTLETIFQSVLTDRTADYVQISRRLSAAGWGSDDEYLCLILQITYLNQKQLSTGAICHYIQKQLNDSVSFLYQEEVVSFFNLSRLGMDEEAVAAKLVYFIRDSYLKAGYSRTMKGHMNLRRQYVQARTALDVGSRKKPYLWIHYFNQVALPYIIEQSTRRLPANMICHEGLLRLKEQDEKNHTEYMQTLRVYLDQQLNATQTAKELFIHRSTFLYRLEKIKEILHSDLEDADEIFYLELSFRLLEQNDS